MPPRSRGPQGSGNLRTAGDIRAPSKYHRGLSDASHCAAMARTDTGGEVFLSTSVPAGRADDLVSEITCPV